MVERKNDKDAGAFNWLQDQFKKLGWNYKERTVYKVVARKGGKESVFLMPGYSPGQVERYLLYLGWEYVAGVKSNTPEEAADITADRIKVLGMKVKGES